MERSLDGGGDAKCVVELRLLSEQPTPLALSRQPATATKISGLRLTRKFMRASASADMSVAFNNNVRCAAREGS
jgi:hypothetical protein